MGHSTTSNSVKHVAPRLKKDDVNEYMAWGDAIQDLIFATYFYVVIDEKKMNYVLRMLKNHYNVLNMDPNDTNDIDILNVMT